MNKRKIMTLALSICMIAILVVGGSLAYLTDTDNKTNTFTVGDVQIVQNEKDRTGEDFKNNQKVFPIVDDKKDADGYHLGKNYVDKIVTVTNTGSEEAFIRTFLAVPAELDNGWDTFNASLNILHWNAASANDEFGLANSGDIDNDWWWGKDKSIDYPSKGQFWHGYKMTLEDGSEYNVYIATHKTAVKPEETTSPTLFGLYFDKTLDYGDITDDNVDNPTYFVVQNGAKVAFDMPQNAEGDYTWDVLVASQAVQAEGFGDAYDALAHAFGDPTIAAAGEIPAFTCPFGGTVTKIF